MKDTDREGVKNANDVVFDGVVKDFTNDFCQQAAKLITDLFTQKAKALAQKLSALCSEESMRRKKEALLQEEYRHKEDARNALDTALLCARNMPPSLVELFSVYGWFANVYQPLVDSGMLTFDGKHLDFKCECNNTRKYKVIAQFFRYHTLGENADDEEMDEGRKRILNWKVVYEAFGIPDFVNLSDYSTNYKGHNKCKEYLAFDKQLRSVMKTMEDREYSRASGESSNK